jgi:hypothetical protein
MVHRPAMIRDRDKVEIRLTREAEYRLPFTFIEALNEGTLFDRPAHVFRDAAPHETWKIKELTPTSARLAVPGRGLMRLECRSGPWRPDRTRPGSGQ